MPPTPPPSPREVLFEITNIGNTAKVVAVDSLTGTEVTLVGPLSAGVETLKRNAVQKLKFVLQKKGEK